MKKHILIILSLVPLVCNAAIAGWPVGKNHYIISPALSLYLAKNRWDAKGNYVSNTGQSFYANTLAINATYGLTRTMDVSVGLPVVYQSSSYMGFKNSSTSLGDLQLGLSFILANFKYANYISLYVGAIAPLYTNTSTKFVGLGNAGANIRLSNSGSLGQKTSYNIDCGFSQYIGTGAPQQYLTDLSVGYSLNRWNQIGLGAGAGRSISSDKRSVNNILANRDFDYVRVSANYGHSFTKRINVNLSTFYTVAGRNTGEGYGGTLALMYRLPYR